MTRPRLLDLFCGAGGAAMGYHRAGFDVVGVDVDPQPHYPFPVAQLDALAALYGAFIEASDGRCYELTDFSAAHASPVCLTYARVTDWRGSRRNHPDTLTPALDLLPRTGLPYVVENVPEACPPLRADLMLCGSQFGLKVKRHRAFQRGGWGHYDLLPACGCGRAIPFEHKQERAYADAMGCDWMTNTEGRQAIPPAYTEYIGRQLFEHLAAERAS